MNSVKMPLMTLKDFGGKIEVSRC